MSTSRRQSGFTLLELLITIMIVGLLAAISIPVFNGQRVKAKDSQVQSNVAATISSIVGIYASEERWPNPSKIIGKMTNEEPSMTYIPYIPGTSESTGPRNMSVTVEDAAMLTLCSKSISGEVYCTRRDSLALLPTAVVADTGWKDLPVASLVFVPKAYALGEKDNTNMTAYAHAPNEPAARAKLPTRASPNGQQWLDYPVYQPATTPTEAVPAPTATPVPTTPTSTAGTTPASTGGTTTPAPNPVAQAAAQEPAGADPCMPDKNRGHGNDCYHFDPDNPGNGGGNAGGGKKK